ncbi:TBC domain-containing protein C4G8.04 [Diplonema papillatum]|nr:TBC domain-containing protein C4G8.04 [Diplonema papillatum]
MEVLVAAIVGSVAVTLMFAMGVILLLKMLRARRKRNCGILGEEWMQIVAGAEEAEDEQSLNTLRSSIRSTWKSEFPLADTMQSVARTGKYEKDNPCASSFAYISADLNRTFPGEPSFDDMKLDGNLRLVLHGVAERYEKGYIQGMNEIAALALLHLPPADAELLLLLLLTNRRYSLGSVMADANDVIVHFSAFLRNHLPDLSVHFDMLGVTPMYYIDWFSTVFVHVAPVDEAIVIFDAFIREGWLAVYRCALYILELLEPQLLKMKSLSKCVVLIRSFRLDPPTKRHGWVSGTARKSLTQFPALTESECNWAIAAKHPFETAHV